MSNFEFNSEKTELHTALIAFKRTKGAKAFGGLLRKHGAEQSQDLPQAQYADVIQDCRAATNDSSVTSPNSLRAEFKAIADTAPDMPTTFNRMAKAFYARKK